jgi:trk system potassium uptake protein TrkA
MRQVAVIGLGKFGSTVARELTAQGAEVIAVDRRREHVEEIKDEVAYAAVLNATDENALRGVGVQNADVAVVCIGDDVEASLLTTLLLKKMGVKKIWSRSINPLQQEILRALDVDAVLNLEEEMGRTVARSLVSANVARYIPLGPDCSVAEVKVPASLVSRRIRDTNAREAYRVNIVAVKREVPQITDTGARTLVEITDNIPSPDLILQEGDTLVVVGHDRDLGRFAKA